MLCYIEMHIECLLRIRVVCDETLLRCKTTGAPGGNTQAVVWPDCSRRYVSIIVAECYVGSVIGLLCIYIRCTIMYNV